MSVSDAKQKAKTILRELGIDRPEYLSHLKEICCERGAFVREAPLENAEARLTVNGDRGVITVQPRNSYAARTRFSIAHELGHFELHRNKTGHVDCGRDQLNDWAGKKNEVDIEAEANEFAAELLMPEEFIRHDINKARPAFAVIESLAERYQTSLFATTRRFIELTHEACAAVFFKNGLVQYVWRSSLFEEQRYQIEGQLDPYSYAYSAAQGMPTPPFMSEVAASAWLLNVPPRLAEERILEEARWFQALDTGMSLLWIHRPALIRNLYC